MEIYFHVYNLKEIDCEHKYLKLVVQGVVASKELLHANQTLNECTCDHCSCPSIK